MITLEEYRESLISDIGNAVQVYGQYPEEAFIEECKDLLTDYHGVLSDINNTFCDNTEKQSNRFRKMHIDASYLELSINTVHLLYSDYNAGEVQRINNEYIKQKTSLMLNFVTNSVNGYFNEAAESDECTQFAQEMVRNLSNIYTIHLVIISTNQNSERLKTTFALEPLVINGKEYKVNLTLLDIKGIYDTKSSSFQKEDIIIDTKDYGLEKGIPCIKADIESEDYDSYLAVVPGKFLSDIYLEFNARLLENNVRSYLNTRAEINKGILNTILNNKSRFFAYNNGIATTASEIEFNQSNDGLYITKFTNLQIINGGQTTATLATSVLKHKADLSGVFVQMKLSIIKNKAEEQELVRLIANYANKQNKVTKADLNTNHPYYTRIEEFSRRIKTPLTVNSTVQKLWFFERARGQYDQAKMSQQTEREKKLFDLTNPKTQKFTKTDLAKYMNAADMKPHDVSWGADVNMTRFQVGLEKEWKEGGDNPKINEGYYKELIAKAIMYKTIERIISNEQWYLENKGYRAQLVPYTFSKLVYEASKIEKYINYKKIWDKQEVPEVMLEDIAKIAKLVHDVFNDPKRQFLNIGEYAKREACWTILKEKPYNLSDDFKETLIEKEDIEIEQRLERSEQKVTNEVSKEIDIFQLGVNYWNRIIEVGTQLGELNYLEEQLCQKAIKYCQQKILQLNKREVTDIWKIKTRIEKYLEQ